MGDYDKYRKIKTVEEHQRIIDDRMEELRKQILNKTPRASEIPMFRNCEFDLDKLNENLKCFLEQIEQKENEEEQKNLKSSLSFYLANSFASYLAPAINFNLYLDLVIQCNLDMKNGKMKSSIAQPQYTVHVQNIIISIKCMLDRLVPILSFYYPGLQLTSTFGRVGEGVKTKGVMSEAMKRKEEDKLLGFIYSEYERWIKSIVEPRDMIIHYNDMQIKYHYTHDGREFPKHYSNKIFDDWKEPVPIDDFYYYKSLMNDVGRLYEFLDRVFAMLLEKSIKYSKQHRNKQ